MLYVIGERPDGVVKIGTASNPQSRLRILQTASPLDLRLLLSLTGGVKEERALHDHFAARAIRGEWFDFSDSDAVSQVIENIYKPPPKPNGPAFTAEVTTDLRTAVAYVFAGRGRISTKDLLDGLIANGWRFSPSPQHGGRSLARMLGVEPRVLRFGERLARGYLWADITQPGGRQSQRPPAGPP